ncbi:cation diffusion facilitator CzcD-associated flavoprotein CzcO [Asanoa ferruginea]|uniref:Cation diffusion facilitator CzcD-associated flavoprotein CzcO n=1 Tax=Asanoa ferruginea TaxID=53367 RepID=A0A3D9ZVB7_9ACTN|nr:NAD(P)/FAD-dependent oxidoreductase [Asanoa ferruginea]REG01132.1 cation diffusion facilitator CzcD-associated flavoprotein CzcO [Asanoa ferruginea]GIF47166.1 Baeyer-Villiger monooxygenase [Asanoa ferruginea]
MTARNIDVLIIGSGFSGIALGRALRLSGRTDFVILEREPDVGGVWRSNTYPGCTCDVPSHLYSFSFAPNPDWSSTYSPQPEIQDYLRRCVDRFALRPHLRANVEVTAARWVDGDQRWHVSTSQGEWTASVLVSAVGPLTEPKFPDVPGIDRFAGKIMHSARWDHSYNLAGKRVASIGTGASAIQYVPEIADEVGRLFVFQRSAPWITPHDKRPITDAERHAFRSRPIRQKIQRAKVYAAKEAFVLGMAKRPRLMRMLEGPVRRHMERQVGDPALRKAVTPDFTLGCKRILPSNTWYPALQKPSVELVPHALAELREHSVVGADGIEREVDTIIFGTGYHVTDMPFADKVHGRAGTPLNDVWAGSPRAYLGVSVPGFPNYFMLLGPNSGLGHSSMVYMIEAQAEHVKNAISALDRSGATTIEVTQQVYDAYNADIDRRMATTVWEVGGCRTFYQDANGRNATIYPDWTFRYRRQAVRWRADAYRLTTGRRQSADAR